MHIYQESFIDTNFGDNLFVHIVTSKFKNHTFHMTVKEGYKKSYPILCEHVKNINLIYPEDGEGFLYLMDAMLIVGGDMFGDYVDYSKLHRHIQVVKSVGGFVGFFGISLFPKYCEQTTKDLTELFEMADVVVVRESSTYKQIRETMPNVNVVSSADLAFSTDVEKYKTMEVEKGLLGISIREKTLENAGDIHEQYVKSMAETATKYLQQDENNKVALLALSSGLFDDVAVAKKIMDLCPIKDQDRIYCEAFRGDVDAFIATMQKCERMVCTRFHALVFAILLNKEFVPVVYETKMKRLLAELEYTGIMPIYEDMPPAEDMLASFADNTYSKERLEKYKKKTANIFDVIDKFFVSRIFFKVKRKFKKFLKV